MARAAVKKTGKKMGKKMVGRTTTKKSKDPKLAPKPKGNGFGAMEDRLTKELIRLGSGAMPEKSGGDTGEIAETLMMLKTVQILKKEMTIKGLGKAVEHCLTK